MMVCILGIVLIGIWFVFGVYVLQIDVLAECYNFFSHVSSLMSFMIQNATRGCVLLYFSITDPLRTLESFRPLYIGISVYFVSYALYPT